MITNTELTVYHKTFNQTTRLEEWTRYNYSKVWWFGGKGANINKGYENANDVDVRIPYNLNQDADIANFAIGDIIYKGKLETDITSENQVPGRYNITSITNNTVGSEPHIHIGGR